MASLDAYSWQSAILEEYQLIQEAGTSTVHDMSIDLLEENLLVVSGYGRLHMTQMDPLNDITHES